MGSYEFRQKCIVINNLYTNVLLGTDALVNHGMILNYRLKTFSVGKISLQMHTKESQSFCCLALTKRIEIPALQTYVEWVVVPESFKESLLLQGELLAQVKITNGLYDAKEGRVPIIFINQKRYPVVLEKGKHLPLLKK